MVTAFPDRELHVVLDNLNTHKKCDRWLKKHQNVHFHFTPTRSSWLNRIETWFSILQGQSLNGASFTSVEELQEHIDAFISAYNLDIREGVYVAALAPSEPCDDFSYMVAWKQENNGETFLASPESIPWLDRDTEHIVGHWELSVKVGEPEV